MDYLLKRWPAFTRFLEDGWICLSNNAAERALRGVALGRRSWLFCGSDRGGQRAAAMYTLIGRLLLSIFFAPGSTAVIWRVFVHITDPIVRAVGAVSPRIVPPPLLVAFAIVWCLALRMVLLLILTMYGLAPRPA